MPKPRLRRVKIPISKSLKREIPPIFNFCANCNAYNVELSRCKRCYSVYYCNGDCQREHWEEHKKTCVKSNEPASSELCACGCGQRRSNDFNRVMKRVDDIVKSSASEMKDFERKQYNKMGIRGAVCITERTLVMSTFFGSMNFLYFDEEDIDELCVEDRFKEDVKRLIRTYDLATELVIITHFESQHVFQYAQMRIPDITHEEATEALKMMFQSAVEEEGIRFFAVDLAKGGETDFVVGELKGDTTVTAKKKRKKKNKKKKKTEETVFTPIDVEVNDELIDALYNIQYDTTVEQETNVLWEVE